MKSTILFIIAMSLCTLASAQHFTDANNNWLIGELNWDTEVYVEYQFRTDVDTMINGVSYTTLHRNDDVNNPLWYRLDYYLREDMDKRVYIRFADGQEGILYHFGLEPGQTVTLWNGISARAVEIDSVEVAQGQMARRIQVAATRYDTEGNEDCTLYMRWIDGIGVLGPLLFDYCPVEEVMYALGCFFRNESLYYPSSSSWCEGFVSATESIEDANIGIYPNPVKDMLTITLEDDSVLPVDVRLFNTMGQLMGRYEVNSLEDQIDLSGYASGLYVLQVLHQDHALNLLRVVKQ